MRLRSRHIHFAALHRQMESTKCGKCEAFGLAVEHGGIEKKWERRSINECDCEAGIFILRRFTERREHEVRQRGNNRNKGFEILVKWQSFSNQY